MTLANVVFQLWFLNYFLHNAPNANGIYTLSWFFEEPSLRKDPLITIFPRLSNCNLQSISQTGRVTNFNALCVLQFNGVNEAMYLIIFAWLLILFMLTTVFIAILMIVALIPQFRIATAAFGLNKKSRKCLSKLLTKSGIGGWFQYMLLRQNESVIVLQEFLETVTSED